MMTREELCEICRDLEKLGHAFTVTLLLKHDREQREALALAEAERDAMESMVAMLEEKEWAEHASKGPVSSRLETCITTLMNELYEANERADEATVSGMAYAEQRDTAQAQLAQAVGLLTYCAEWCVSAKAENKARDFVARHAQAEQQEAPCDQDGEFWTWLALAYRDSSKGEGRKFTKHNMEAAYRSGAKAARAALATQPAAYVLTKDGEIYWEGDDGIVISNTPGDCLDERYEWRPVGFMSQPAVRGAEHE